MNDTASIFHTLNVPNRGQKNPNFMPNLEASLPLHLSWIQCTIITVTRYMPAIQGVQRGVRTALYHCTKVGRFWIRRWDFNYYCTLPTKCSVTRHGQKIRQLICFLNFSRIFGILRYLLWCIFPKSVNSWSEEYSTRVPSSSVAPLHIFAN